MRRRARLRKSSRSLPRNTRTARSRSRSTPTPRSIRTRRSSKPCSLGRYSCSRLRPPSSGRSASSSSTRSTCRSSVMTANRPIHYVKDFQGLKLRIQGSKVLNATARAWGAIPQVMAFSEVYQALQTGVVDGLENVPSNIWTQKFYEVVKYIAVSYHGHLSYAVVANKKYWDGLPADVRPPLEKALTEASEYFNAIAKTENDEALEEIKKTGKVQVYPLTPEERRSWLQAVLPVHKEMENRIGKDVIDALYKIVDFRPDA